MDIFFRYVVKIPDIYKALAFLAAASHKYVVEIYSIIGIYPVAAPEVHSVVYYLMGFSRLGEKGHVIIVYNKLNYFRQHNIKVSPKAEANGLQFKEGFIVIEHISKSFHLSAFIQNAAKGALYRKIKKYNKFSTPDIKAKLLEEFNQRYKTRPIFLRICYRIQKLISKHK